MSETPLPPHDIADLARLDERRLNVWLPAPLAATARAATARLEMSLTDLVRRAIQLTHLVHTATAEGKVLGVLSGSGPTSTLRPFEPVVVEPPHASEPELASVFLAPSIAAVLDEMAAARGVSPEQIALEGLALRLGAEDVMLLGERLVMTTGEDEDLTYQVITLW